MNEKTSTSKIETIALFLAYVIVADGFIDNNELLIINAYIKENKLPDSLIEKVGRIYSDSEDKEPLDNIFTEISKFDSFLQQETIKLGLTVAYSDYYFDEFEEIIFEDLVNKIQFSRLEYFELKRNFSEKVRLTELESDENETVKFFMPLLKMLKENLPNKFKLKIEKLETEFLLSGKEYTDAITLCSNIAKADFEYVKGKYEKSEQDIQELIKGIEAIESYALNKEKKKDDLGVEEILKEVKANINEKLFNRIEENKKLLKKKERALSNYTITFIGRTKAGKSTLHSVITGQGSEFIGVGKQRTTRYNRSYFWKNIRIIDTPGVASGEKEGANDTAIASSVIDESDVICYIVTNDSIQESEFSFLKQIREKNKPVIIVLNVKENLENESRFNLFLKDPNKWHERKDEKSIQGHIERLNRYAKEHYRNGHIEIYPMHVLCAKMAKDKKFKIHQSKLWESSKMQDFLNKIRLTIIDHGSIRRSQTILDNTIHWFYESRNILQANLDSLTKQKEKMENTSFQFNSELEKIKENYKRKINNTIESAFSELTRETITFSNIHYDSSEDSIRQGFKNLLKKKYEKLDKEINGCLNDLQEEIKEDLKAVFDDFESFFKIDNQSFSFEKNNKFDFGKFFNAAGAMLAIGTVIAGLFTGGAGLILGGLGVLGTGLKLLSSYLFDSKDEIKKKKVASLNQSLIKNFDEQQKVYRKESFEGVEKIISKISSVSDDYFIIIKEGLVEIIKLMQKMIQELEHEENELNRIYAWRIQNYLVNKENLPIELDTDLVQFDIVNIAREFGKDFKIQSTHANTISSESKEKISQILQEKITFI